jgi:hypothetical protein
MNQHHDVWYFKKEQFELLITWMLTLQFIYTSKDRGEGNPYDHEVKARHDSIDEVIMAAVRSQFRVELLKEQLTVSNLPSVRSDTTRRRPVKKSAKRR